MTDRVPSLTSNATSISACGGVLSVGAKASSICQIATLCLYAAGFSLAKATDVCFRRRLKVRLHFAACCATGCTTGWTKRFEYAYNMPK